MDFSCNIWDILSFLNDYLFIKSLNQIELNFFLQSGKIKQLPGYSGDFYKKKVDFWLNAYSMLNRLFNISGESYYNLKDISEVRSEYSTDIFTKIKSDPAK